MVPVCICAFRDFLVSLFDFFAYKRMCFEQMVDCSGCVCVFRWIFVQMSRCAFRKARASATYRARTATVRVKVVSTRCPECPCTTANSTSSTQYRPLKSSCGSDSSHNTRCLFAHVTGHSNMCAECDVWRKRDFVLLVFAAMVNTSATALKLYPTTTHYSCAITCPGIDILAVSARVYITDRRTCSCRPLVILCYWCWWLMRACSAHN